MLPRGGGGDVGSAGKVGEIKRGVTTIFFGGGKEQARENLKVGK